MTEEFGDRAAYLYRDVADGAILGCFICLSSPIRDKQANYENCRGLDCVRGAGEPLAKMRDLQNVHVIGTIERFARNEVGIINCKMRLEGKQGHVLTGC